MNSLLLKIKHNGLSMYPSLNSNVMINILLKPRNISVGDIVYYKDKETKLLISHRVISMSPFLIKGDRNLYVDSDISLDSILGIIVSNDKLYWGESGQTFKILIAYLSCYSQNHYPRIIRQISQALIYIFSRF